MHNECVLRTILKQVFPLVFTLAVTSLCLFGSFGRLNWPNAWILLGLNFAASVAAMIVLGHDPELRAERANARAGKDWDKPIVFVVALVGPAAIWITAGLDARFRWSTGMGRPAVVAGVIVGLLSIALITCALRTNRFFSAIVRIQKDRGHVVVSSGPYRFIRHPAYAGMAAFTLVTPLILDSRWAFIPAAVAAAFNLLRTVLEDRTLHRELDGYTDYARRVKHRLVPLIW
jgi:protein-S-isoprenylcysteine O-methyltransferase Ste14